MVIRRKGQLGKEAAKPFPSALLNDHERRAEYIIIDLNEHYAAILRES